MRAATRASALGWLFLALPLGVLAACGDDSRAGQACSSNDDCDDLVCRADNASVEDLTAEALSCGKASPDKKAAGAECTEGSDCALGICLLAGACAEPCSSDDECASGQRCEPTYARASAATLQTLHACVNAVNLPKDVQVKADVRKHALHGTSDRVALPGLADADTTRLLVLEHLGDHQWPDSMTTCRPPLCVDKLETRDAPAITLFDAATVVPGNPPPKNPVANGKQVMPVVIELPNGPDAVRSAAGYNVTLRSELPGDLRITTLDRKTQGRRLDLNIFYVGADDLEPTKGTPSDAISSVLETVDQIFQQADVFLGDVRHIVVPGKLLERGAILPADDPDAGLAILRVRYDVYAELPTIFSLGAGANNVALDVFLLDDIESMAGGELLGIAGGTPIALGMHGLGGVAISASMMQDDPTSFGRTLAHELGHALGLFHVVELDGSVSDPFPDTPLCSITRDDTNHDGILTADECAAAGADNLMFPTSGTNRTTLSADQIGLLRAALILQ